MLNPNSFSKNRSLIVGAASALMLAGAACNPLGSVTAVDSQFGERTSNTSSSYTWNFSNASNYSVSDSSRITLSSGAATLNEISQTASSTTGFNGDHDRTRDTGSVLTLKDSSYGQFTSDWTPQFSNLVAYWKLDETASNTAPSGKDAEDSSGNGYHMNEVAGTATYGVPGQAKNGIRFTGDGTYSETAAIATGPLASLNWNSDFSVSFWIRHIATQPVTTTTVNKPFYMPGSTGYFAHVWMRNQTSGASGQVTIYRWNGTTSVGVSSTSRLTDNQYHHVGYVKEGSTLRLYIDGVLEDSISDAAFVSTSLSKVRLNLSAGSTTPHSGDMDEVAIWNTPLTTAEMQTIYARQSQAFSERPSYASTWVPQWSSLLAYWPLAGNALDYSGNIHHGTLVGNTTYSSNAKMGGYSASFDGSGDEIHTGTCPLYTASATQFTYTMWVYTDLSTWDANYRYLVDTGSGNPYGNNGMYLILEDRAAWPLTEGLRLQLKTTGGGISVNSINSVVPNKQWFHVAATYNGTSPKLYINGKDVTGTPSGNTGNFIPRNVAQSIGGNRGLGPFDMSGNLAEFAVFSTALTQNEIQLIYDRQKQKHSGLYTSPVIDTQQTSSDWTVLSWITTLPFFKELAGSAGDESVEEYSEINNSPGLSADLSGLWHLNETSTSPVDSSGQGNTGSLVGSPTQGANGILNNGISLDGVDDYVDLGTGSALTLTSSHTVSAWIKIQGTSRYSVYSRGEGMELVVESDQSPQFRVRPNTGSLTACSGTAGSIDSSSFHLLTGVYDDDADLLYLYLNGRLVNTCSIVGSGVRNSAYENYNYIGAQYAWHAGGVYYDDYFFKGNIDEVALWTRALSSAEVLELYRRGANRIKFQVRSCDDSACSGESWLGADGSIGTWLSELQNCTGLNTSGACNYASSELVRLTSPSLSFADFSAVGSGLSVSSNRYFQYRVLMESEDTSTTPYLPTLTSTSIGPAHIYTDSPSVYALSGPTFKSIKTFSATTSGSCTVSYQLSLDQNNWFYFNGGAWAFASSVAQSSSADTLNSNISTFTDQVGTGSLYFKAFLTASTGQTCALNSVGVTVGN